MTPTVFDDYLNVGRLNPRAQEFVPKIETQSINHKLQSRIETSWGDECGNREWGDQIWNSDNQWELQVNRLSAKWGNQISSPVKTHHHVYERKKKLNKVSQKYKRFGWEDKANLMSSIWSHTPDYDDWLDNTAFLSHFESTDEKNLECRQIAATPCTARLLVILQNSLKLKIPYAIITDFLMAYAMVKPIKGRKFFKHSELEQICLSFWGPIMAEHGCPIKVRYEFNRISENIEWAQVCADFHSNVEVIWVGTVCRYVPTQSLHICPAPGNKTTIPGNLHNYAKDTRKPLDLAPICSLKYLENVVLHALPVVDISELVCLHQLRELNLSMTLVEDFAPLSEMISLERLDIHGTTFCDLSCLPSSSLTSLRVNDTNVRDLSSLVFCQKLSLLELSGCPLQNIEPLAVLRSLKYLYLSKTAVFDIYPLSAIATLKFLDLSYTCVSDVHALGISLARHKALEYVNLEGAAVTDFSPLRSICVIGKSAEDSTEEWGSIK
jgi:hypothetical protein